MGLFERKKALKVAYTTTLRAIGFWCRWPDSNRHGGYPPHFECGASANSATSAHLF